MANHDASTFGLNRSEGELLITRLIHTAVTPERMRNDELLNLADSLRLINDRLPGLLHRHKLLAKFWDRIEAEITLRLIDDLTGNHPAQIEGQTTLDDITPSVTGVAS